MSSEVLVLLGSIERSQSLVDAIGLNCGIWESPRRQGSEKLVGSRSLEGSSTWCKLSLEGLLLFVSSTYSLVDRFTAWRAVERFFAEFFGFLFNNTSACYLVSVFFFPTLLAFILLLCFDKYGLK